ncbi:MAG: sulfite exporter TauE/SafE family protein [Rhodobacter sp.]|nr:sulfite exporter TauE/SafE family protein [Rhodobacter sp.]
MFDPIWLILICLVFTAAGFVKGIAGVGLPATALGLMAFFEEPRVAIALVLFPMLLTNAWQVYRSGDVVGASRRYAPFAAALVVGVIVTVVLTANAPDRLLLAMLGVAVLIYVLAEWSNKVPPIGPRHDRAAQIATGGIAGFLGGLTAVWAPPMAVYLAARRVGKDEFVRASGLLIFLGSVPLAFGYLMLGHANLSLVAVSVFLLLPSLAGFSLGESIRHRLSEHNFRKFLLWVFVLLGLNLIRRAVTGL